MTAARLPVVVVGDAARFYPTGWTDADEAEFQAEDRRCLVGKAIADPCDDDNCAARCGGGGPGGARVRRISFWLQNRFQTRYSGFCSEHSARLRADDEWFQRRVQQRMPHP